MGRQWRGCLAVRGGVRRPRGEGVWRMGPARLNPEEGSAGLLILRPKDGRRCTPAGKGFCVFWVFIFIMWGVFRTSGARGFFAAFSGREIPPLGAGYFVLGGKVPKAPPKNPWFLGTSLSPLRCAVLSPAHGHREDSRTRPGRYALLR